MRKKQILPILAILAVIILVALYLYKTRKLDSWVQAAPETLGHEHTEHEADTFTKEERAKLDDIIKNAGHTVVMGSGPRPQEPKLKIPLHRMKNCEAFEEINNKLDPKSVLDVYSESLREVNGASETAELRNSLRMLLYKEESDFDNANTERELFIAATFTKDKAKSKKLFRALQEINSNNGAYFYFNLVNLETKDQIRSELAAMVRAKSFDTHMSSIYREMWEHSLNNFPILMGTLKVFANVAFPDFSKPRKVIKNNINLVDAKRLEDFSEMIVKKNLRFEGQFLDVWWNPLEYASFEAIHRSLKPKKKYPHIRDLMKNSKPMVIRKEREEVWKKMNEKCSDEITETLMSEERVYFREYKRRIAP